jgi:putative ABC transport system ATP-binding protein
VPTGRGDAHEVASPDDRDAHEVASPVDRDAHEVASPDDRDAHETASPGRRRPLGPAAAPGAVRPGGRWHARRMGHRPEAAREGFRFVDVTLLADGTAILDGVSVVLACEGITAVAGPSGSGKSTLLRLCNRLEAPTSGEIRLDGEPIAAIDPTRLRRRVGMVFQRPVVFGGTVLDNLRLADPAVSHEGALAVLARCGLGGNLLERRADDLSGGEAQRMCLARTLLTDPEVVLMDEVTSSLDVDARQTVEQLARRLADEGIPVVWVTHDLDQAERLADHLVVLVEGRVVPDEQAAGYLAARSFEGTDASQAHDRARDVGAAGGVDPPGDDHGPTGSAS